MSPVAQGVRTSQRLHVGKARERENRSLHLKKRQLVGLEGFGVWGLDFTLNRSPGGACLRPREGTGTSESWGLEV